MYAACAIIHYFKHSLIQNTYLVILNVDPLPLSVLGLLTFTMLFI